MWQEIHQVVTEDVVVGFLCKLHDDFAIRIQRKEEQHVQTTFWPLCDRRKPNDQQPIQSLGNA